MKKLVTSILIVGAVLIMVTAFRDRSTVSEKWDKNTTVNQVLSDLGEKPSKHFIKPTSEQIKKGEEIVKNGFTTDASGRKTTRVSKHYVCTSCHNIQREDPILSESNPETRLPYVKEHKIPFLQGTTFWGMVNRESWYNDDYVKKYGDEKIEKAHKSLRESIQLCAIECSQGRPMKDWEIEAVLAYSWSLELKISDLDLSEKDWSKLKNYSEAENPAMIKLLKSKYATTSPAHFYDAPKSKKDGYPNTKPGNPEIGKDLYDLSCKFCHQANGGVSHYILDESKLSFQNLKYNLLRDSHKSLYQIVAYGTYAIPGHKPYMPHYPKEKMSKQQVEDLRAYIELRSK